MSYAVEVGVGSSELADVAAVEDVPVVHVGGTDFFFLLLGQRSFFVHPPTELICPVPLRPTAKLSSAITALLTSSSASPTN